jgi:hypothetical protein
VNYNFIFSTFKILIQTVQVVTDVPSTFLRGKHMPKKRMAQRDIDIVQASMLVFHVPTAWDDVKSGTNHWRLDNGARVRYNVTAPGNSRFDIVINAVGRWGSAETPSRTEPANALSDYAYICKWVADDDHLLLPPEKIWKSHFARMLLELRDRIRADERATEYTVNLNSQRGAE